MSENELAIGCLSIGIIIGYAVRVIGDLHFRKQEIQREQMQKLQSMISHHHD
jgi:uncharacterized membrane-anchored protein YhcB (DUF1043 family)